MFLNLLCFNCCSLQLRCDNCFLNKHLILLNLSLFMTYDVVYFSSNFSCKLKIFILLRQCALNSVITNNARKIICLFYNQLLLTVYIVYLRCVLWSIYRSSPGWEKPKMKLNLAVTLNLRLMWNQHGRNCSHNEYHEQYESINNSNTTHY